MRLSTGTVHVKAAQLVSVTCGRLFRFLVNGTTVLAWSCQMRPRRYFAEDDDVAPDVVWISKLV